MPEIERRWKKRLPVDVLLFDGTNGQQVDDFTDHGINFGRADGQIEVWNSQEKAWIVVPVGHRVVKSTLVEHYPMSEEAYQNTTEPAEDEPAPDAMPDPAEAMRETASRELAAAMSETRKQRDIVCKLLDLFSAPDDRRMRHASVTVKTLERYAAEAGVRP